MVTNDVEGAMGSQKSQSPTGATPEALRALSRLSGLKRRRRRVIGAGAAAVLFTAGGVIWSQGPGSDRSRQLSELSLIHI